MQEIDVKKEKQRANIKKSLELKDRLARLTDDPRMFSCGRPKSLRCKNCGAISLDKDYLQFFFALAATARSARKLLLS